MLIASFPVLPHFLGFHFAILFCCFEHKLKSKTKQKKKTQEA